MICPHCGSQKGYRTDDVNVMFYSDAERKREVGRYKEKQAVCKACGLPIYVREIADENAKALAEYRRSHDGFMSLEEIKKLPKKYDIDRKSFVKVCGFKSTHIISGVRVRFNLWKGDIPTHAEDAQLKRFRANPKEFMMKLEKAKPVLEPEVYERSMKRTKELVAKTEKED